MIARIKLLANVLSIALLGHGSQLYGQSSGQLKFTFEPDKGMEYVLDGKYRMSEHETTLIEGAHRFTFWAPERSMLDTTINVLPDVSTEVFVRLRYTQDFVDHRKAAQRYERNKRWATYLPPVIVVGAATWAATSLVNLSKADQDLSDLAASYSTSSDPAGIQRLKYDEIPAAKTDLSSARTQAYVASGVFVVSLAGTLWLRHRMANSTAPVFEDKEKVRFDGLVWIPGASGGTWAGGVSIPLR